MTKPLLAHLGIEGLVELAQAVAPHVRDVEVAHPAAGELLHPLPVPAYPVEVAQVRLGADRPDEHLLRFLQGGTAVEGQLDGMAELAAQQAVGVVTAIQVGAVDRQQVVADVGVDPDLGQRRAVALLVVLPLENAGDPVAASLPVELEFSAQEGDLRPLRDLEVAPFDIGMGSAELRKSTALPSLVQP